MKPILLFTLLCFIHQLTQAQARDISFTIEGVILDIDGTPVPDAIILIDGESTDKRSDYNGNYAIKVKQTDIKIAVIAPGAGFLEVEIGGRNRIDFVFGRVAVEPESTAESDDVIENTGYGATRKKYSADAVGFLDVEHSKRKYATIQQILMETPGLIFVNGMYVIAGARTFQGFVSPLYVVDDIPMDFLPSLIPSQVATVTVLKGSSAAIYGARAYGGVVLITTRIE